MNDCSHTSTDRRSENTINRSGRLLRPILTATAAAASFVLYSTPLIRSEGFFSSSFLSFTHSPSSPSPSYSFPSPFLFAEAQSKDKAVKLPSHALHRDAIPWIRCDVCAQLVANSYDIIDRRRSEGPSDPKKNAAGVGRGDTIKRRQGDDSVYIPPPREEEVMEELETVCNPFSENGWWIRYWGIKVHTNETLRVSPSSQSAVPSPPLPGGYEASLEPLPDYMKCKGHCLTIADACQLVYDTPALDKLSGVLFKWRAGIDKARLQKQFCKQECVARDELKKDLVEALEKKLAKSEQKKKKKKKDSSSGDEEKKSEVGQKKTKKKSKSKKLSDDDDGPQRLSPRIMKEKHEPIEEKDLDVEEMIDRMSRTHEPGAPKMDVFTRDTITEMQAAITHGTKEQAALFDPSVADLSDEEFEMLQKMFKDEKGHEYPEAPDFEAAAIARGEQPGSPLGKPPKDAPTKKRDAKPHGSDKSNGKLPAAERIRKAEEAIKAQIDKLSDEEVAALIKELEADEAKRKRKGQQQEGNDGDEGVLPEEGGEERQGGLLDLLGLGGWGRGSGGDGKKSQAKNVEQRLPFMSGDDGFGGEEQPYEGEL